MDTWVNEDSVAQQTKQIGWWTIKLATKFSEKNKIEDMNHTCDQFLQLELQVSDLQGTHWPSLV